MLYRSSLIVSACLVAACTAPLDAPAPEAALTEERVTLDDDGRARVEGRLEAVLPNTDADRVIVLDAPAWLAGTRVLDARFVPGAVAVIGADHVLRVVAPGEAARVIDEDVYGPLTVAGERVAYVRGAPPDLELARADVRTGEAEALTESMAPVWSPALSSDGEEIVFVSGASGSPRLHRRGASGAITALAPSARVPSAPTAPRWAGTTLVFEDEQGVAWLDLEAGTIVGEVPGARGLRAQQGARGLRFVAANVAGELRPEGALSDEVAR